jgi:hypothetical protein
MTPGQRKRLFELFAAHSADLLTPGEHAELQETLRREAEARRLWFLHQDVELGLHAHLAARPAVSIGKTERMPRYARRSLMAAAAAVLILAGLAWWRLGQTDANRAALVTVLFAEDCRWEKGRVVKEGERLPAQTLHLAEGTAILRFAGGAEVILRGGTEIELLSAASARLRRGDVTVRADGDAEGFKLLTPASELTDLGTEFAVKVEPGGATELHVIEGEVAYGSAVANTGQAVRLENARSAPKTVALQAMSFSDSVKMAAPRERRDLMTAYDGFLYDEGVYRPEDLFKGKGWAGPWRLRQGDELRNPGETDSTQDMRIVHGALEVSWPIPGGRLGGLEMPAGRAFRLRPLSQPIAMNEEGITYFSLMTLEPDHSPRKPAARPQEGVRLTFRSSADYWGALLSFGWDKRMQPHIQAGAAGRFASPATLPDEQSLLWVGKIIRRATGEDEIFFRIYGQEDVLDFAEPPTWHVASRGLQQDAAFDLVVLSSTGRSPRIVDELRIGPTWRSVVPIPNEDLR